jgi:hypothetical protein
MLKMEEYGEQEPMSPARVYYEMFLMGMRKPLPALWYTPNLNRNVVNIPVLERMLLSLVCVPDVWRIIFSPNNRSGRDDDDDGVLIDMCLSS